MRSKIDIRAIFNSNITTRQHFRSRYRTYLLSVLASFKYLLIKSKPVPKTDRPCILYFSTESYFDIHQLPEFELLVYKEKVSRGVKVDFRKEETLMALAFLMPYAIKKRLYEKVYQNIEKKLSGSDIKFFICTNAELLNFPIAHYLKDRGIPSGTIQHGIYMPDYYEPNYYETELAQYIFVWGEVYKDMYHKRGVPLERLQVVSPPFYFGIQEKDFNNVRPVFLGQPWYKLSGTVKEPYSKVIENLADYYSKQGIKLKYKPHPREIIRRALTASVLAKVEVLPKKNVNGDFYADYTHAFSVNSTALLRALCSGLACYQVDLQENFPNMDYYKYSSIPTLYTDRPGELLEKPIRQVTEQDINPDFLHMKPRPTFENAQILKQVINKSATNLRKPQPVSQ